MFLVVFCRPLVDAELLSRCNLVFSLVLPLVDHPSNHFQYPLLMLTHVWEGAYLSCHRSESGWPPQINCSIHSHTHTHLHSKSRVPYSPHMHVCILWGEAGELKENPRRRRENIQTPSRPQFCSWTHPMNVPPPCIVWKSMMPNAVLFSSRHIASHSQGAPQAQVHRQALQEDVLPQRVDWQVQEVEGGGTQWQQLWRLRQVTGCSAP